MNSYTQRDEEKHWTGGQERGGRGKEGTALVAMTTARQTTENVLQTPRPALPYLSLVLLLSYIN